MKSLMTIVFSMFMALGASSKEMRVTSSMVDLFRDGRKERVSLVMTEGKKYNDTNEWCGMGYKYEGRFSIVVTFPDGRQVATVLWPGLTNRGDVFFNANSWEIYFVDYNHDGIMDFNLGQYAGCNGSEYTLFSFKPDGEVFEIGHAALSGHDNSTDSLKLTKKGYSDGYYNNTIGGPTDTLYGWDKAAQTFIPCLQIDYYDGTGGPVKRRVEKKFNRQTRKFEIIKDEVLAPNPQGGANGSQPLRSETNRTSSAAGSHR